MGLTLAYRGNFGPSFSTESHVAASLEAVGHEVIRIQESEVSWAETERLARGADSFWWTQTYGYACNWDRADAFAALKTMGDRLPTVGYHLDRWWGLEREWQVHREANEPFFCGLQHLFTADGDSDERFAAEGINHHWLPPAVYGAECTPGRPRIDYDADVAFVGAWRSYGHEEWWPHRQALLGFLKSYPAQVRLWPKSAAIRGQDLNDLYASTRVVVGDSCFADRSVRYFSDRAFETVGRGGFLIFPYIEGLAHLLIDGEHCRYYQAGDFAQLRSLIGYYLAHDQEREAIRRAGQAHVRDGHTYAHRVQAVLETIGLA